MLTRNSWRQVEQNLMTELESLSSKVKELLQFPITINVPQLVKNSSRRLLEAFVGSVFESIDQPLLPSQSNFAPVEETGEGVHISSIEGGIPDDFKVDLKFKRSCSFIHDIGVTHKGKHHPTSALRGHPTSALKGGCRKQVGSGLREVGRGQRARKGELERVDPRSRWALGFSWHWLPLDPPMSALFCSNLMLQTNKSSFC
ncbi:uncharacterized protein LOC127812829 [Diospyros lotus]|uniref:uncharacterized protein LOC127812829 n=1 Tax=Diospyros lotus TaxID=55363 RepID=UPI00225B5F41|nr:uncharacterized protein LOC127812829 [Diospyros lotus]